MTAALERCDQAAALALEIGRPDRTLWISSRAATKLLESRLPVPEALERCRRILDVAPDHSEAGAFTLLAIGELEARTGVRDRWRRHFDKAKGIIDDLGLMWPLAAGTYPVN